MNIAPSQLEKMFQEVEALYQQELSRSLDLARQDGEFTTGEYRTWLAGEGVNITDKSALNRLNRLHQRAKLTRRKYRGAWLWKQETA